MTSLPPAPARTSPADGTSASFPDYPAWAAANALTGDDRRQIDAHIAAMPAPPLISVLLPVHNTPALWLRACLDSVLAQRYPHWELCIADDASTQPAVRPILAAYAEDDPRIQVVFRPENGHICAATNSALALATGRFVVLLDHDDTLAEHALYLVAALLQEHPDAALIYSDEDYVDHLGRPLQPWFKPAWNPDLLHAYDYIGHLVAVPAAWLRDAGGMRPGFEGAQDYDLLLRCTAELPAERIHHIPHVLYHWRAHFLSVAGNLQAKRYVPGATRRALTVAAAARGAEVIDVERSSVVHRVRYPLPSPAPLVSVLLDATRGAGHLDAQLAGLQQTQYPALEVIVAVDGPLPTERLPAAQAMPWPIHILRWDRGGGNSVAARNACIALAHGEVLCFLEDGAAPAGAGWLEELVRHALRPEVGAVGPHVRRLEGKPVAGEAPHVRREGLEMPPWLPSAPRRQGARNVAMLSGACLVLRRGTFQAMGGFDTALPPDAAVAELGLRLRQRGEWLVLTPFAEVEATQGEQAGDMPDAAQPQPGTRRLEEWDGLAAVDPFANPNLTWRNGKAVLATPSKAPRPWQAPAQTGGKADERERTGFDAETQRHRDD